MELRQLEYFVAVAEECHFTRAAQRMRVAQSGLSASIRSLERELGAPLFVRSTRRVGLTDAGRALLPEARQALAKVEDARDVVAAVRGLLRGTLRVGTLQCLSGIDVPRVLAGFHAKHPHVEIRLQQDGTAALLDGLRSGRLDLAFTAVGEGEGGDLELTPIAAEPMVLACALEHRFAERDELALAELDGEPFVDFTASWGTREVCDGMLAARGVGRRVELEVNDVHTLIDLVSHGLGLAIVPEHFSAKTGAAAFVPIAGAAQWRTAVAMAKERAAGTAARALREMVRDEIAAPNRL
ncbi:LysR family transcriptional regulator [Allosalinactinospora lopnorensis]|uniref:LysR family transcriptional regulator n=1 Tax=Allosalinactinospora lopnorensis TaxID=1352348 RepID=UPI000623D30B|nr:LysR family transcriptional regulator [Allosalinactinospora lopnorensis]